ncbi:MAG: SEC-C domain-containing protein, partial [Halioglobus sp.]|nr:SEC-C domain-containing protein [Halioglobus sp.]
AEERIKSLHRAEVTQFERWVLLQILDQAWKDHLYAVDQLRESIGLRSFSQRDPRIEFKREGARLFEEMQASIRDKVTDLIFKAKLTPQQPPPQGRAAEGAAPEPPGRAGAMPMPARQATPPPAQSAVAAAAAAASAGTEQQRRDMAAADQAGTSSTSAKTRSRRQPAKASMTVGRNEPCPCDSGKKYKHCCGKRH